jgi:hypothetical protein
LTPIISQSFGKILGKNNPELCVDILGRGFDQCRAGLESRLTNEAIGVVQ